MRALVVSIWVFINLVFFGMCSYMYLLWSQYWMYLEKETQTATNNYEQQIYLYNRGYPLNDTSKYTDNLEVKNRTKHATKENNTVTIIKNSKPRFPNLQSEDFLLDTDKFKCGVNESALLCDGKILEYEEKILNELKRVFMDESNVLKSGLENMNPYHVSYKGPRGNYMNKGRKELLCQLKRVKIETLKRGNAALKETMLREFLPRRGLFESRKFKSCAIIASSGSLKGSNLGKFIDSHDLVLRFNHAPTHGFEADVGSKTTMRILNSQVVTKPHFKFLETAFYRNVTLLAWDPTNYTAPLADWYGKPEFDLFPNYIEYRKRFPKSRFYLLNPQSLWKLWDYLQSNSPNRLRRNPPSSGFLGLAILLPVCDYVDIVEYIPSVRVTRKCHYYDTADNPACTFGVWHPLAAEKLLTHALNIADGRTVFATGYARIAGFKYVHC